MDAIATTFRPTAVGGQSLGAQGSGPDTMLRSARHRRATAVTEVGEITKGPKATGRGQRVGQGLPFGLTKTGQRLSRGLVLRVSGCIAIESD